MYMVIVQHYFYPEKASFVHFSFCILHFIHVSPPLSHASALQTQHLGTWLLESQTLWTQQDNQHDELV